MGTSKKTEGAVSTTMLDHDRATVELLRRLAVARKAIASWKDEESFVREQIIKTFGADQPGTWQGTIANHPVIKVSVRPVARFDSTAFHDDHPDLYEQYKVINNTTVVTVDGRVLINE